MTVGNSLHGGKGLPYLVPTDICALSDRLILHGFKSPQINIARNLKQKGLSGKSLFAWSLWSSCRSNNRHNLGCAIPKTVNYAEATPSDPFEYRDFAIFPSIPDRMLFRLTSGTVHFVSRAQMDLAKIDIHLEF